ncbi:MAG: class I SAM-dependent methyltransferase [Proteobacteria bacterium]|nr:class I SAM-dependent methyltransferase [Pseudomonadota bacterium]
MARALLVAFFAVMILTLSSGCSRADGPTATTSPPAAAKSTSARELQSDDVLNSYLDPTRNETQQPDEVVRRLGLKEGHVIADIGAGSGYFTWVFSKAVGSSGKVLAVDIDAHALEFMQNRMVKDPPAHTNIKFVESKFDDVCLPPASVDWAFLCEAHFIVEGDPSSAACLRTIRRALKPGGKVAVIEVKDDPLRGKVSMERLQSGFLTAGFAFDSKHDLYDREYFVVFR